MVTVDIDHPDIENYIDWKVVEEQKVAALVAGSKLARQHLKAVMAACWPSADSAAADDDESRFDPKRNRALKLAIKKARGAMIPDNYVQRVMENYQVYKARLGQKPDIVADLRYGRR